MNNIKARVKHKDLMLSFINNDKNIYKILETHNLDFDKYITITELEFAKKKRADIVLYGLINGLVVLPIAIEITNNEFKSIINFLDFYREKLRSGYNVAFPYIYIATSREISENVKSLVESLKYGFIKINTSKDFESEIIIKAQIRGPLSEYYYEVTSQGVLYLAFKELIEKEGFYVNRITSNWIGFNKKINYCAWILNNYANFGVYEMIKQDSELLNKIPNELYKTLSSRGYRVHIEIRFMAGNKQIGQIWIFDDELKNISAEKLQNIIRYIKDKNIYKRHGVGIGIYKRLWHVYNVPLYPTALQKIRDSLYVDNLILLKDYIKNIS